MKKNLTKILLILCLAAGIVLIFNQQIKDLLVADSTKEYQLKNTNKNKIEANEKAEASFDYDQINTVSLTQVMKARLSSEQLPVIGGIAIPSVAINLPVFKGLSDAALLSGAGTLKENQQMGKGNYALASHHMKNAALLFSPLEKVHLGDKVYLTDLTKVYAYEVTYKEKVAPDRVELIDDQPGKKLVTLVTCGDAAAATRLIVQGELTKEYPVESVPEKIAEAFKLPKKAYS